MKLNFIGENMVINKFIFHKRLIKIILIVFILALLFYNLSDYKKSNNYKILIVNEETELIEDPELLVKDKNNIIFLLKKGYTVELLDTVFTKEFMFFKVKAFNKTGYVINDGRMQVK